MAISVINVWNMALRKAGSKPILSADEVTTPNSEEARVCSEFYESVRDSISQAYQWNSLISRAALVAEVDTPAFGYDYQYPLPADCLRVLQMENPLSEWKVEQRKLLTDETEVKIIYIARVVNPNDWHPLMVEAVYTALAAQCAISLAKDPDLAAKLIQELNDVILPRARKADAQEGDAKTFTTQTLLDARYQGTGVLYPWEQ